MKLFWSPRSPYVRKVMIIAHEAGVAERIVLEGVAVTTARASEAVMAHNPFGKIPTLVLDDGEALPDSFVICEFLAAMNPRAGLSPAAGPARFAMLRRHAFANEMTGESLALFGDLRQPERETTNRRIALRRRKLRQAFDFLEGGALGLEASAFDIGHAALGAALGYVDFRHADERWREGRPRLARWQAQFARRPSAIATAPYDETAVAS